jgi:hypothetical protein
VARADQVPWAEGADLEPTGIDIVVAHPARGLGAKQWRRPAFVPEAGRGWRLRKPHAWICLGCLP